MLAPRPARAQARAPGSGTPGLAWGPRANACFSLLPSSPCRLFVVLDSLPPLPPQTPVAGELQVALTRLPSEAAGGA